MPEQAAGLLILVAVILAVLIANIRIVPQSNSYVIERLGRYLKNWDVGLHVKIPVIDVIRIKVSLKEKVVDFPPQPVITKDNVSMSIDTVVYYQVTDPKAYAYGVQNPLMAIENLTATTLRNILGQLELDESLSSRDHINGQMRIILDEATDPWGIKVNRVEVKNIMPPHDIQEAMEKQMRAERERRRAILEAEGEKKAAILKAEGERESRILMAEGEKQSLILDAEGKSEAAVRIAKGEAEALRLNKDAEAYGITQINETNPSKEVIALKSFETMEKVSNGNATKIIIPSELQNLGAIVSSIKEM